MKKIFTLICFLVGLQVYAQTPEDHTLSITAEGSSEVVPDIIRITLTLNGTVMGKDAKDISMKICDKALEDLGIKGNAYFEYSSENTDGSYDYNYGIYDQANPFYFNRSYTVVLSKMEDYTKLMEASSKYHTNGVNATAALTYVGLNQATAEAARLAAFRKAIEQAKTKAGIVAQVLGVTPGEVTSVSESYGENYVDLTSSYYNYYIPGKPLKIPYIAYAVVQFRLK